MVRQSVQTNEPIGGTFYIQVLTGSGNNVLAKIVQCSIFFFFYHFQSSGSFRHVKFSSSNDIYFTLKPLSLEQPFKLWEVKIMTSISLHHWEVK